MARIEIGRILGADGKTAKFVFTARDAYEMRAQLKARGYTFARDYWVLDISADPAVLQAEIEFGKTLGPVFFGGQQVP